MIALVFSGILSAAETDQDTPQTGFSGNPIFKGWYADPEVIRYGNEVWIYPTYSDEYEKQIFFDCFSSKDLVKWTKHERILDNLSAAVEKCAGGGPKVKHPLGSLCRC
jgi:beta-xylosidase